jgi:hypothetical protein
MDIQHLELDMAKAKKQEKPVERQELSGVERLGLRVSSMINHPVAQTQRWVTIHRLDTDGDREWEEVMGVIADTDELELTLNNDGSVTVRWEQQEQETVANSVPEFDLEEEAAPF